MLALWIGVAVTAAAAPYALHPDYVPRTRESDRALLPAQLPAAPPPPEESALIDEASFSLGIDLPTIFLY